MKIAIVGSRNIDSVNMKEHLVKCDEIISGGAKGIDSLAAKYANENNIKLTEFLPEYNIYGKAAPIIRNKKIVDAADKIIVFWDGVSKGSLYVINYAKKSGKECIVILCK